MKTVSETGEMAMIDSVTRQRIEISTDGTARPYIMLPLEQLEPIRAALQREGIPFWVDSQAIALNGKREIIVVNLGRGADPRRVQQLLDAA